MRQALVATLILALSAPVLAHGGQYKGPSDAGGPSSGSGGNAAPPTNPAGAAAPGPGAASGGGGTGPAGGGAGTRGAGRATVKTGGGPTDMTNYEAWEFWWEANKDQYLNLKAHMVRIAVQTGSSGDITGRGKRNLVQSTRPSLETVNTVIIPTLENLIKGTDETDILDSSILAMGRVAHEDAADRVIGTATPLLSNKELSVRTASALTLGVLGSPKALPILGELMTDSTKGRQFVAGKEVDQLTRALAALSLGLINDPTSVKPLIDIVQNSPDKERDVKATAIVALGLMKDNPNKAEAYKFLLDKLGDRKLDAIIKSYVPTSLGKLEDPAAVPALLDCFKDRDTDNYVRQSAAIGLGLLATIDQKDVMDALQTYLAEGKDAQTRHFILISLAQIGRRDAEHEQEHKEAHEKLAELFGREITKPKNPGHRSWAALAAAIYAREGGVVSAQADFTSKIEEAWKKENDKSYKSAFAVALGLLDDRAMAPVLADRFETSKEEDERGYTAVALGFLKYKDLGDKLRAQLKDKTIAPTFRLQVATGLGLMGDPDAVNTLVESLQDAQTLGVSSAVAKALGLIGDEKAVDPLKAIATDEAKQMITRAFAAVALGIVGEKSDLPWNARISADNNYRAQVNAIAEVLDVL